MFFLELKSYILLSSPFELGYNINKSIDIKNLRKEYPMVPFFLLSVIFVLVLAYFIRKNNRAQAEVEENFWERERQANATRRQDITNLEYINIPIEKIPQNLHTETEKQLVELCGKKMINLTDLTNTEVKLKYGPANLDALTEYESNYISLLHLLPAYCQELMDNGYPQEARELLLIGQTQGVTSHEIENMLLIL